MQELVYFSLVAPKLYRYKQESAYVYLPGCREEKVRAEKALDQGGTFLYLRNNSEHLEKLILFLIERTAGRPQLLFLDNMGENSLHWDLSGWSFCHNKMIKSGFLKWNGYRLAALQNSGIFVGQKGIAFKSLSFGAEGIMVRGKALFSWEGFFQFQIDVKTLFSLGTGIRYETDGYDDVTKRRISVLTEVNGPVLCSDTDLAGADGQLYWDRGKSSSFSLPGGVRFTIPGFPQIETGAGTFHFVAGNRPLSLNAVGDSFFCSRGKAAAGNRGFFQINEGDRIEFSVETAGALDSWKNRADLSLIRVHAPLTAAGVELSCKSFIPVLPPLGTSARRPAELLLKERMEDSDNRLAYTRDVKKYAKAFETCLFRQEMVWFNIFGDSAEGSPGIALCHLLPRLSLALASEEFFAVFDAGNSDGQFTVPYTLDNPRLKRAVMSGYPPESAEKLKKCYPAGRVFLSRQTFTEGVLAAGAECTDALVQKCHHFQIEIKGISFNFLPESWEANGVLLAVKRGQSYSLSELAEEPNAWSLPPDDIGKARTALRSAREKAQGTIAEPVFCDTQWQGSVILNAEMDSGGLAALLVLPAGHSAAFYLPA